MADNSLGLCCQNLPIPYLDAGGFSAVQTRGIDSDGFSRKQPADRQRFKRSLPEPLLLTINGEAELILKTIEGGH
jgi:hypothetical protein